jgi:hypothetical protein
MLYQVHLAMSGIVAHYFSCKSNYYTITTMMAATSSQNPTEPKRDQARW